METHVKRPDKAYFALPLLVILFAASGCAALIYEVVWFQLLELVIGSTAVSLGVLLATFMGGMCAGSLLLPRLVSAGRHPLRVYAWLELGIAACALLVLFGLPLGGRIYAAAVGYGAPGLLLRAVFCACCLLPPTLLMGASLPAVARWVRTTPEGVARLGFFYFGNLAGAVAGCLVAGFYLLRLYDTSTATYAAAAMNLAVALAAFALAAITSYSPAPEGAVREPGCGSGPAWTAYLVIGLSGMCALGAEVVWTRLLALTLGPTVYTFSLILAAFLGGLAAGSSVGALVARLTPRPRFALAMCQMLIAGAVAWAAYSISSTLPLTPISTAYSTRPWVTFQLDLMRCLWVVLPAACLWGASFPLALAAAAQPGQDPARLAGRTYAANTLGAIVGALAFSLLLIPMAGTRRSGQVLIALSALAAAIALVSALRSIGGRALAVASITACAVALAVTVSPVPWEVFAYGRHSLNMRGFARPLYVGEGLNASVAVSVRDDGARQFHVSGKVEASADLQDMRMQRMLGHLPALVHGEPRTVLVVGCGAGVTAGALAMHPSVRRIVIVEIEPLVPKVVAQYFAPQNHNVLGDRRTEVVYDDARHFILTTREKFDVITSDPIHPWVKGAATLYSREYFELCRRQLSPGGVIAQWVPLYESTLDTVKSEIATFFSVFPGASIWSNNLNGPGYDVVLLGQAGRAGIDIDAMERRLTRADHAGVLQSLREARFGSAVDLLATYAGQSGDLNLWLRGAQISQDRNLRLEYLAGMGLNDSGAEFIYDDMLLHRRFPENLFLGSPGRLRALRATLGL
ncbi:MAG: spermidine synthase [Bryobacteraceae bacterium]